MAGLKDASYAQPRITIGVLLRTAREAKGLMIREIAAKIGVDSSHLGKFERDKRVPPPDLADALAAAYGVPPNDLKSRIAAKKLWDHCGDDPRLVIEAAAHAHEDAAAYGVNNQSNKF